MSINTSLSSVYNTSFYIIHAVGKVHHIVFETHRRLFYCPLDQRSLRMALLLRRPYTNRGFFYGIGHTKICMFSALAAYFFNIMFNYLLIFGKYGFPCIGLAGAGLSASIGMFLGFLFFVFATFLPYYRTRYKYYRKLGIGLHSIGQIVKI
jgi:hypothetical protein